MRKRILPAQNKRVETGVTQFSEDWPGVFIRGDNAFYYAMCLEGMLNKPDELDPILEAGVKSLLDLLKSSRETGE